MYKDPIANHFNNIIPPKPIEETPKNTLNPSEEEPKELEVKAEPKEPEDLKSEFPEN